MMRHLHAQGQQTAPGELPAGSRQHHHPELDLMPIRVPSDPDIAKQDRYVIAFVTLERNAVVHGGAVACHALQGLVQYRRGCEDVIHQSDFPQIEALGEVETEEFILQRDRGELEKPDLRAHRKADGEIFGLSDGQASFLQQRLERNSRLSGTRKGEARESAQGGWHSLEPLGINAARSVFHSLVPNRPVAWYRLHGRASRWRIITRRGALVVRTTCRSWPRATAARNWTVSLLACGLWTAAMTRPAALDCS